MGRVIAVTNIKGGIGKTTTAINIAAGLALMGAKVLLVDTDAQGNLAMSLGIQPKHTIYEVLVDGVRATRCIVPARPNLDLLASDDTLLGAQPLISRRSDWARVLDQALVSVKKEYDFIFIDSPGSLSIMSINALMSANEVLVPTTVEHLSIKGLDMLFKQIKRVTTGENIIRMIIPTMFDSRLNQSHLLLKHLETTYGHVVAAPIRINVKLSEASSYGKTIFEFDPHSRGALDYARLVKQLSQLWEFQPRAKAQGIQQPSHTETQEKPLDHQATQRNQPTINEQQVVRSNPPSTANGKIPVSGPTLLVNCPHCGHMLRRTIVAGYRVAYCDHCTYRQQELASGLQRS